MIEVQKVQLIRLHLYYVLSQVMSKYISLEEIGIDSMRLPHQSLTQWIQSTSHWRSDITSVAEREAELACLPAHFPSFNALSKSLISNLEESISIGCSLIHIGCPDYPEKLRLIADPPLAFFAMGDVSKLQLPSVAIVGSRRASGRSLAFAEQLAGALAGKGFVITSGGAIGCDTAAHLGALRGSSKNSAYTTAVFASGVGQLYPTINQQLFREILARGGCLLSERLVNQHSRPFHFLARNRLVSGLSILTIIVQAEKKSGALSTASHAISQGREVLVLSHDEDDVRAEGNRTLILDGAESFETMQDFFHSFQAIAEAWS